MTKRVLLCDDEIHVLRAAQIKVSRAGYEVALAHNGLEAWEMIQHEMPDMLVTDVQMPLVDGIELTALGANPVTKHIPILMLTAKGYEFEHEEITQRWGLAGILSKPFSPRELVERIEQTLGEIASAAS